MEQELYFTLYDTLENITRYKSKIASLFCLIHRKSQQTKIRIRKIMLIQPYKFTYVNFPPVDRKQFQIFQQSDVLKYIRKTYVLTVTNFCTISMFLVHKQVD